MKELKEIKNITDEFIKKTDKFIEKQKEPKLKRCPFCGGKPVLLPDNTVECMTIDCPMHPDYIMPIEKWNNRENGQLEKQLKIASDALESIIDIEEGGGGSGFYTAVEALEQIDALEQKD